MTEFKNRHDSCLSGFYRGIVLKHLANGKCKIWIPGVYPDEWRDEKKIDLLPSAEQASPLSFGAADGNGIFSYPNINAVVWCFFERGDQNFPVYFASTLGGSKCVDDGKKRKKDNKKDNKEDSKEDNKENSEEDNEQSTERNIINPEDDDSVKQWNKARNLPAYPSIDANSHLVQIGKAMLYVTQSGYVKIKSQPSSKNLCVLSFDQIGNIIIQSSDTITLKAKNIVLDGEHQINIKAPNIVEKAEIHSCIQSPAIELDSSSGHTIIKSSTYVYDIKTDQFKPDATIKTF